MSLCDTIALYETRWVLDMVSVGMDACIGGCRHLITKTFSHNHPDPKGEKLLLISI